jgi:hypothetical protein
MADTKNTEKPATNSTVEDIAILEEAVATSVGTFGTPK